MMVGSKETQELTNVKKYVLAPARYIELLSTLVERNLITSRKPEFHSEPVVARDAKLKRSQHLGRGSNLDECFLTDD
ncbi:hypothetical protein V6N12_065949 [Hibiscus sabdariffa]|uniref:Uncharacterized protein n=1 Tax=Hibiscus sabdariffa TaxID=183260 RepID=A0ABR1ZID3_9ROSI